MQRCHGEKGVKAVSAKNETFTVGTWKRAKNTVTKARKAIGFISWAGVAGGKLNNPDDQNTT